MLACSSLGDDSAFLHSPSQEDLPKCVVDFVRTRVKKIFTLQINIRAACMFCQTLRVKQRCRTASVVFQQTRQLGLKRWIFFDLQKGVSQLFQRGHQCLGHKSTAVWSPVTQIVWL